MTAYVSASRVASLHTLDAMPTSVRLDDETTRLVDAAAKKAGVPRSKWVRETLRTVAAYEADVKTPKQTAGSKSGQGFAEIPPRPNFVSSVPTSGEAPPDTPVGAVVQANCKHSRWRRLGGRCTICGAKVK